jgi:hypothetical protein
MKAKEMKEKRIIEERKWHRKKAKASAENNVAKENES